MLHITGNAFVTDGLESGPSAAHQDKIPFFEGLWRISLLHVRLPYLQSAAHDQPANAMGSETYDGVCPSHCVDTPVQ